MLRVFREHAIRPVESLDGVWEFQTQDERKSKAGMPKAYSRIIHVPSAWEQIPGLENYRGKAWLRRHFTVKENGKAVRMVFGGVSHTGTVYVDGKKAGWHYDAFTPWDVVVPGLKKGKHEVVVEVDNTFGPHSALHMENDYYTFGGITRPAELQFVPAVHIDKLHALPIRRGKKWDLHVQVTVRNLSRKLQKGEITATIAGSTVSLGKVTIKASASGLVKTTIKDLAVTPWSGLKPKLYDLHVMLCSESENSDDLIDRIGFREIKVQGKKVLLNGKSLRLRGYNRHEDHPQFGNALPVAAMVHDLNLMRDLGCNFIRTCHYPNDMRFLDLCAEMGFYVWEESHSRCTPFWTPKFMEQIQTSGREMVEWHYNNPAIIMWGSLNECESHTPKGRGVYAKVLGQFKKLDPSRPVTFASCHPKDDLCFGLVDIVGLNRYQGWYGGKVGSTRTVMKDWLKWLHSSKSRGGKGKPVIMSEFGGGAIYGCRNPNKAKWTEEFQAETMEDQLGTYLSFPDVIGVSIWQFCDVRVTPGWWFKRPRTMNNKGTVDEYRRPKLVYQVVKKLLRQAIRRWGG